MSKVAFVFPGQGSQKVGMGREAFDASALARQTFEIADSVLGEPLSTMCFEGPGELLQQTANTQPALLATSVALWRALGESCDVVAGHSLGEYCANVAAGALGFEDAVALVRHRGRFMQAAVPLGSGAMAAVLGASSELVQEVCQQSAGQVEPANFNCPGQIVIAGAAEAMIEAASRLKAGGAKVISLPVSAPFHTRMMLPAEQQLEPLLTATPFADVDIDVYTNLDAQPKNRGSHLRDALIKQVSRPVRWQQTIERMLQDGVGLFVEIGPGKVLCGLVARIDRQAKCVSVQGPGDFEAAAAAIAAARACASV